ncbi:uncharacterized protein METZ01_LOCUS61829 [marine metagenome]|uniref:Uncharacterized protein n=1 Tax=marine metagenome TaxID=408172 RepID=A0A381SY62_9ZZZZ
MPPDCWQRWQHPPEPGFLIEFQEWEQELQEISD